MRAHIHLKLRPDERIALRALNPEERDAVIDELLAQAREDLEWVVARAAVPDEPTGCSAVAPARPTPPLPPRPRGARRA